MVVHTPSWHHETISKEDFRNEHIAKIALIDNCVKSDIFDVVTQAIDHDVEVLREEVKKQEKHINFLKGQNKKSLKLTKLLFLSRFI